MPASRNSPIKLKKNAPQRAPTVQRQNKKFSGINSNKQPKKTVYMDDTVAEERLEEELRLRRWHAEHYEYMYLDKENLALLGNRISRV